MTTATSLDNISTRIATRLAQAIGPRKFAMWFDRAARFELEGDGRALSVKVANKFLADGIGRQFQTHIGQAAFDELGHKVELHLHIDKPAATAQAAAQSPTGPAHPGKPNAQGASSPGLSTRPSYKRKPARAWRHSLDEFVVGPGNELAFAAASRLANSDPGNDAEQGSPLFIHGGCGLGKTHLLQSICRQVSQHHPQRRVRYTTGEQFTNEYITAVRSNTLDAFRRKVRRIDLLAVDDIHFLASKEKTQQEFLHCFNEIELGGAHVVLASDSHPKLIKQFCDALVSRCVRGMVVQIDAPDTATRLRIVEALAERRGLAMTQASAQMIADRCDGSVRDIEGALNKLQAMLMITRPSTHTPGSPAPGYSPGTPGTPGFPSSPGTPGIPGTQMIGHALVDRLFHSQQDAVRRKPVRFEALLECVCQFFALPQHLVTGRTRRQHVVLARSLAIYLARELTAMSYPEIATAMGRPNHSTIVTAAQRMKKQLQADVPVLIPGRAAAETPSQLLEQIRREVLKT